VNAISIDRRRVFMRAALSAERTAEFDQSAQAVRADSFAV